MCQELVKAKVSFKEAKPFIIAGCNNKEYAAIGIARVGRGDSFSIPRGKEIAKGRALKALTLANQGKKIPQRDVMKMGYSRIPKE